MAEEFLKQIDEPLACKIGTLEESLGDKLDSLAEGQQLFSEKKELLETHFDDRIDGVMRRIDAVAVDVVAHRRDTEAHRKGWRVSE